MIEDAGPAASLAGIVALLGLLWGASGMMSSIRAAFRAIWSDAEGDPYLGGKLLDVVLVLAAGVIAVCAFGLTVVAQFVASASTELVTKVGVEEDAGAVFGWLAQLGGSLALTFVAFLLLYDIAPPVRRRLRESAPGALVATVGFHIERAEPSVPLHRRLLRAARGLVVRDKGSPG